jgi:hypothetical protein
MLSLAGSAGREWQRDALSAIVLCIFAGGVTALVLFWHPTVAVSSC